MTYNPLHSDHPPSSIPANNFSVFPARPRCFPGLMIANFERILNICAGFRLARPSVRHVSEVRHRGRVPRGRIAEDYEVKRLVCRWRRRDRATTALSRYGSARAGVQSLRPWLRNHPRLNSRLTYRSSHPVRLRPSFEHNVIHRGGRRAVFIIRCFTKTMSGEKSLFTYAQLKCA